MADEFNWSRPGLNESQLHALAILTNIYYNPVTPNNPEPELEDLPEPEDPDEYHPDELKRYFLDRLAEIWSRRPNGDIVSAAVLQETKAGVTVWLCRNQDEHCNVEDNEFRSSIEKFMRAAAQRDYHSPEFVEFWGHLIEFYRPRIDHYVDIMLTGLRTGQPFIPKTLKRGNHEATSIPYSVIASLQEIQRLLLRRPRPLPSDSIEAAILIAHGLRQEPDIGSFIQRLLARHVRPKFLRDLEKGILFLGRVRSAYNCFLICTRTMAIFRHTTIKIVKSFPAREPQPRILGSLQVANLLQGLRLQALPTIFPNFQDRFQCEWRQPMIVHAEVTILIRLEERNVDPRTLFNYVGCSKKSCFLCCHFLRQHGFRSCGCHNKVYHRWTVPEVRGVSARLVRALLAGLHASQQQLINHIRGRGVPPTGFRPQLSAEYRAGLTPLRIRVLFQQHFPLAPERWNSRRRRSDPVVA